MRCCASGARRRSHRDGVDARYLLGEVLWQVGAIAASVAAWRDAARVCADAPRLAPRAGRSAPRAGRARTRPRRRGAGVGAGAGRRGGPAAASGRRLRQRSRSRRARRRGRALAAGPGRLASPAVGGALAHALRAHRTRRVRSICSTAPRAALGYGRVRDARADGAWRVRQCRAGIADRCARGAARRRAGAPVDAGGGRGAARRCARVRKARNAQTATRARRTLARRRWRRPAAIARRGLAGTHGGRRAARRVAAACGPACGRACDDASRRGHAIAACGRVDADRRHGCARGPAARAGGRRDPRAGAGRRSCRGRRARRERPRCWCWTCRRHRLAERCVAGAPAARRSSSARRSTARAAPTARRDLRRCRRAPARAARSRDAAPIDAALATRRVHEPRELARRWDARGARRIAAERRRGRRAASTRAVARPAQPSVRAGAASAAACSRVRR